MSVVRAITRWTSFLFSTEKSLHRVSAALCNHHCHKKPSFTVFNIFPIMALSVKMNNGLSHPLVGYGTYKVGAIPASASDNTAKAVRPTAEVIKEVLEVGYRCFDCAEFYANEKGVGEALAASGIPRDQLFLISKCWNDTIYAGGAAVRKQVLQSLSDLQTEYIDLYLVHWPVPGKHIDAYLELEKLHGEGKIKSIGLSNYSIEDYEELKPHMTIKPVSNQFEVNPFLFRKNTIDYFQKEGLIIQSYRTLRQGKEMSNPTLVAIAAKYNRPVSQILGRWAVQQNIAYFPKSENRGRMIENMAVTDFELSAEDIATMNNMTTPENIAAFKELYEKCCARDTPLQENREGVKTSITYD
eukprot:m.319200 g.319200  ORF g.319200 m.319200 type:complete len:356 (+) comp20299_c0_seq2:32-1099(+)